MGKIKRKMKVLHKKNVKKAKEKLKLADKGKISYSKLDSPAKDMLHKRVRAGYKLPQRQKTESGSSRAES